MELEVTWGRTFKIWWSWIWRSLLTAIIGGAILGFAIGIIMSVLGFGLEAVERFSSIIGFVFGLAVGLFFLKVILNKKFGDFRVALLKIDSSENPNNN